MKAFAVALALVALAAVPAGASPEFEAPNAVVSGRAVASGAFAPLEVNPNFDFSPVYSLSEISSSVSHGISAGFWPGFLADAFFFEYGYQTEGRSLLGVAESQYPNPPHEADDATGDLGTKCGFGSQVGLPQFMIDGCNQFWAAVGENAPFRFAAGRSSSDLLYNDGSADGSHMGLPASVTVRGVHSTSSSSARSGTHTVSEATVVLDDVQIGQILHIDHIRSRSLASADGTAHGSSVQRSFVIVGATVNGNPVTIDENGVKDVYPILVPAQEQLAAQGIDVRLSQGATSTSAGDAAASSGGLVVRITRTGPPQQIDAAGKQACDTLAQHQPPEIYRVHQDLGPDPLYDPSKFPQNQLPQRVEIDQPLPPVFPCVGLLLNRAVDTGVVLGSSSASARFVPYPPPPVFSPPAPIPDRVITSVITIPGRGSYVQTPPTILSPRPPAPAARPFGTVLSAAAAREVRNVYLVLMLALLALLGGRAAFRRLSRT